MKQLNQYIIEKFKINSNTASRKKHYEEYGKGEFETLNVEDFVQDTFNIKMTNNNIMEYYYTLKHYKIDSDAEFYHITNENIDEKIYKKLLVLCSNDPDYESSDINIGKHKKSTLRITFKNYPKYNLFVIIFVYSINNKVINEYFLY